MTPTNKDTATERPWFKNRGCDIGPRFRTDDQSDGMLDAIASTFGENRENDAALIVEAVNSYDLWQALESNCWDLRCIDIPTGGGDADVGWNVVEHHMAAPKERIVGTGNSPLAAIRAAFGKSQP